MRNVLTTGVLLLGHVYATAQSLPAYLDDTQPLEVRVEDALQRLTTTEKVALLHAQSKFSSPGVPRLGIPEFWATDGPHGIRPELLWDQWAQAGWTNDSCTAFPALTCLAASWDTEMSLLYGRSIGEEARYRGKSILLGPGVNIYRSPLCGRNFEYMGEDPYLAGQMAVPYIRGVQEQGVAACVKHFALNNQETRRYTTNVEVDDRTLYEIYLPAFRAAVQKGGAWAVMGAYNLYKGEYACHNRFLLNDILKGEWGFDGVVVSDWGGTHDTDQAIRNGLDMEFGSYTNGLSEGTRNAYDNYYLAYPYLKRIHEGSIGNDELNDKVRRILRLAFRTTMNRHRPYGALGSDAHFEAARRIGEAGIVLLKNDGNLLPLDPKRTTRIAVIGENAIKKMTVGGGSSTLKARHECTPLEGLRHRLKGQIEVVYARGYVGDTNSEYGGVHSGQDLNEKRTAEELRKEAVEVARGADCVLFFGGLNKSDGQDCEGSDRAGLNLPYGQDALIAALAAVNHRIVVVNISGNAVAMPWVKQVPAIVQAWYLGSEAGHALAAMLTGDVNPSGKLPFTFPTSLEDVGAHRLDAFPGNENQEPDSLYGQRLANVNYREGLFVGYRWTDREGTRPLFPFGHGLSYTTFRYGKAKIDRKTMTASDTLHLTVPITNTGHRTGAEVVQLYIRDVTSSLPRPVKELKGFCKVRLEPGETNLVTFAIEHSALRFFDDKRHEWVAEPGRFEAFVAASSTDIRCRATFELTAD